MPEKREGCKELLEAWKVSREWLANRFVALEPWSNGVFSICTRPVEPMPKLDPVERRRCADCSNGMCDTPLWKQLNELEQSEVSWDPRPMDQAGQGLATIEHRLARGRKCGRVGTIAVEESAFAMVGRISVGRISVRVGRTKSSNSSLTWSEESHRGGM